MREDIDAERLAVVIGTELDIGSMSFQWLFNIVQYSC
jgi:hypothetical protein